MNHSAVAQTGLYLLVLLALAWPLGRYLAALLEGRLAQRFAWMGRIEKGILWLMGAAPDEEMGWKRYAAAILLFNLAGVVLLFLLQRWQGMLPLNPAGLGTIAADSALNTAVSFVTNTNWQGYSGETTMSLLTQMLGLAVQNFLSAATGIAVVVALVRGFVRSGGGAIGNAWLDLLRATLWLLLPLSIVVALVLVWQGVVQNWHAGLTISSLQSHATQLLASGPVASQEAIKLLGTNGGGFFNANSAHPFENPTPFSNWVEMLSIFLVPAALVVMFGRMVGDLRQGLVLLAAMIVLFVGAFAVVYLAESQANPLLTALGAAGDSGNLEGKEVRFGVLASSLFATITTAASCGAVNAMHDSLMPLGGGMTMLLMQLGEVVFGGVGSGLYGMLLFAVLAVFMAGLMIGRTPEYLGKKIGAPEMKLVSVAILVGPLLVLAGTAIAVLTEAGRAGMANPGAHGFSEVLYAFSSAANNNGSAFAGLSANTPFYNLMLAAAMGFGRFAVIVPVLALAGSLAGKPRLAATAGTLPTHGPLFVVLLVLSVLLIGALTYIPALALGPVIDHLQLFSR
ncbi:potassium-transporting ATPase subunit KdpA [Laribacter hongkongensis]|uniref:Potassium-transporting ATPase potassium-binding subunit n=1 Tax=Laribacter hongkongensis TaxID=168471 RepID=A0A248LJV3_9NEIS|nr:potassium-transporting ATPase subunit KdpA [Laribacter hongkongensis]ASJ24771.1 potassium-transporting ATPase potassium-binding subunit [Laribacter hongkongensis]MCG9040552.1 potassium-transporting ATPase subunit KdpA [Laribacter hongkongensis]MCG9067166.1 potassium-transporting ATPase subunit KdpA [Laribacter hongkongensis]MCG9087980.1 potassium-transporting ATPase subunit KdpA [Laribacter hongkongensis]MCG9110509.1 potassium-transporting ATPase subunit KdpA [Laribacter hongkongensis]